MSFLWRFLLPIRPMTGGGSSSREGQAGSRKGLLGGFGRMLRISVFFILFMLFGGAVLLVGFPSLNPAAIQQWVDDSQVLFLPVRICVYVVVVWFGPGWRGATGADRDRARLALVGIAVALEAIGALRLI